MKPNPFSRRAPAGLLVIGLSIVLLGCAEGETEPGEEPAPPAPTLLVAADEGRVEVFDPAAGRSVASFEGTGQAYLMRSYSGRYVLVTWRDGDLIEVLDTDRLEAGPVFRLEAGGPGHTAAFPGGLGIYADEEGHYYILLEDELDRGTAEPRIIDGGGPHHGSAEVLGDYTITSYLSGDAVVELTDTLRVIGPDGEDADAPQSCPDVHGHGSGEGWAVFLCNEYVLAFRLADDGTLDVEAIPYPDELAGGRLWSVSGAAGEDWVAGPAAGSLVVVRPVEGDMRTVPMPGASVGGAVGPGGQAVAVTDDGGLHLFDLHSGALLTSRPPGTIHTEQPDVGFPIFHPVAVGEDRVFVGSPFTGVVYEFSIEARELDPVGEHRLTVVAESMVLVTR